MRAGVVDCVEGEHGGLGRGCGRGGAVAAALILVMAGQGVGLGPTGRGGGARKAMASGPMRVWHASWKVMALGPLQGWEAGVGGVAWVSDFSRQVVSASRAEGVETGRVSGEGQRIRVGALRGRQGLGGSAWSGHAAAAGLGGLFGD